MANINFQKNSDQNGDAEKKRWQKIMDAPDYAKFYDLSTGQTYTRGQFKPLYRNDFENVVDEFQIIGTNERVYVRFLRVVGDKKVCSLSRGQGS